VLVVSCEASPFSLNSQSDEDKILLVSYLSGIGHLVKIISETGQPGGGAMLTRLDSPGPVRCR